jgi:hypothetical protein
MDDSAIQVANTWQIEWVIPANNKCWVGKNRERIHGLFAFDPFNDSRKMLGRYIQIKSTDIIGEYFVTINEVRNRHEMSVLIKEVTMNGSMYSVMLELQDDMTEQALKFVRDNYNAPPARQKRSRK